MGLVIGLGCGASGLKRRRTALGPWAKMKAKAQGPAFIPDLHLCPNTPPGRSGVRALLILGSAAATAAPSEGPLLGPSEVRRGWGSGADRVGLGEAVKLHQAFDQVGHM